MRAKEPIKKICEFCGCEFEAYTQIARYCSHDCNRKAYRKIKRKEVISLTASMASQTKRERTKSDLSEREYISISDAAAIMGVSRWTIYRNAGTRHHSGKAAIPTHDIDTQKGYRNFV